MDPAARDQRAHRRRDRAAGTPAALPRSCSANIVAVLVLYHGLHDVAQRGLNGLSLGAIYALGAVGLTLVYGILKLVNFAHGDFLTFGAYMAYLVNVTWGLPLVVGDLLRDRDDRAARDRAREGDVGADARSAAPGCSSSC